MTRDELQAFVERHLEAWRRRDPAAMAAHHAKDSTVSSPIFTTIIGRDAIEDSYRALFNWFPDWEFTVDRMVIDPPRVAVFTTVNATHVNEFFGLPGTHKRFVIEAVRLMEIEDELIKEERRVYDFTGLLVQLGVLRAKPFKPVGG